MTLLEKIDAVLFCLYNHSGDNPNHAKIKEWLKDQPIDAGEIEDCLLHLFRLKYIYCEVGGQRAGEYYDIPSAHYLISFEGKLFIERKGGFVNEHRDYLLLHQYRETLERLRRQNETRLAAWTIVLAVGTVALFGWEVWKYFVFEGHWRLLLPFLDSGDEIAF